VHQIKSSHSN